MYDAFKGKVVVAMATSPGPTGGLRMLRSLQGQHFQEMGAAVLPGHNSIAIRFEVFDEDETWWMGRPRLMRLLVRWSTLLATKQSERGNVVDKHLYMLCNR